jgi:hypothetical protein
MKEVTTQIRQHHIDTVTPLVIGGVNIPVKNMVNTTQNTPFVIVNTRATGGGTKCDRDWLVTTNMEIIVKTDGDWGGDKLAEDIANEIYTKIDSSRPSYGTTADFTITTQTVEAADPLLEQFNNGRVIRKVVVIENYVSQI